MNILIGKHKLQKRYSTHISDKDEPIIQESLLKWIENAQI